MFKKIRKSTFKDFYEVNEFVAKTSPMMTHYHSSNPAERWLWKQKKVKIQEILNEISIKNILDLGCGDAGMLETIPKNVKYLGIDISPTQIKYAKNTIAKSKRKNADVKIGDIINLNIKTNSFDAILLCDVVEHVLDPKLLLKEAQRIVRNNGYILISIPHEFLWLTMRAALLRFPLHSPDHLHEIDPEDILQNFKDIESQINIPFNLPSKLSLIHIFLIKNVK